MIRKRLFGSPTSVSLGPATFTNPIGAPSWFQLLGQTALGWPVHFDIGFTGSSSAAAVNREGHTDVGRI